MNLDDNIKVVSLSKTFKHGTLSPEYDVNLNKSIKIINNLTQEKAIDLLSPKLNILKNIIKKNDLENEKFKFSIPSRNKNIILDLIFGNRNIENLKQSKGKLKVKDQDFIQILVGVHFLINDFNLEKRIEKEKEELMKRLKTLESLEKEFK